MPTIERTLNLVRTTLYAQIVFSMEDLLVLTFYLKGCDHESEGEAVKRTSEEKRHPVQEKPPKKTRKMVHASPISNKQTSEPIFNVEQHIHQL